MKVVKASGEKEKFSSDKIYYSIRESGASKNLARETTKIVKKYLHQNITTEEILKIILKNLKKEKGVAEKYNLKRAIMNLGPAGYAFERYFSEILESHGYKTQVGMHLQGKKIKHEVDILAEKEKKFMIECKYHNEKGTHTKLQAALAAYARFLDLKENKIDQPWLVTNTKCSEDASNYAKGVNLKITSWKYPENESLTKLIEEKKLYPITILFINEKYRQALLNNKVVTIKSLKEIPENELAKLTKIPLKEIKKLKEKAKEII